MCLVHSNDKPISMCVGGSTSRMSASPLLASAILLARTGHMDRLSLFQLHPTRCTVLPRDLCQCPTMLHPQVTTNNWVTTRKNGGEDVVVQHPRLQKPPPDPDLPTSTVPNPIATSKSHVSS
uniref:Uncharacterized protein n=1 Tax=Odontella aurita TaxID=265563 RepID=A0A7S4M5C4_9STRA